MFDKTGLKKRLQDLRNYKRLSQKEVADYLGITQTAYGKIETGERGLSVEYCVQLAELYGKTCDYILRGIEAENIDVCSKTGLTQKTLELLEKMEEIKGNTKEIVTSLEDYSDGEELDKKGKALLEETKERILQLIANEYIINRFISHVAVNSHLAEIVFDAVNSTVLYLTEEEQGNKAKNRFRRDISAAKFDASQWFAIFFDSLRKSPGLVRILYGDADDVEAVIAHGQEKRVLN